MPRLIPLLATLFRRPTEFCNRVASSLEIRLESRFGTRPNYKTEQWQDALLNLGAALGSSLTEAMAEKALVEIERYVKAAFERLPHDAPYPLFHNGDFRLARLCYACVRALSPDCVIETGVCYGVTSAFILQALQKNGAGTLRSIDVPPLGSQAQKFVGWAIPNELKHRWRLFLGPSKSYLPKIVEEIENVELFLHDSKHTYQNILRELETIAPKLSRQSVVLADDVEGNRAFLDWVEKVKPPYWAVIAEERKQSLLGLAAFSGNERIV